MTVIHWGDALKIGVSAFDEHHHMLVEIINKLDDSLAEDKEDRRQAVGLILRDLYDYTVMHFRAEEDYMKTIGYPALDDHRQMHSELAERLQKRIDVYLSGKPMEISLMAFLRDWLLNHILEEDRKYAEFARKALKKPGR